MEADVRSRTDQSVSRASFGARSRPFERVGDETAVRFVESDGPPSFGHQFCMAQGCRIARVRDPRKLRRTGRKSSGWLTSHPAPSGKRGAHSSRPGAGSGSRTHIEERLGGRRVQLLNSLKKTKRLLSSSFLRARASETARHTGVLNQRWSNDLRFQVSVARFVSARIAGERRDQGAVTPFHQIACDAEFLSQQLKGSLSKRGGVQLTAKYHTVIATTRCIPSICSNRFLS